MRRGREVVLQAEAAMGVLTTLLQDGHAPGAAGSVDERGVDARL